MKRENLLNKLDAKLRATSNTSFNLNFKIEGEEADKFDKIAKCLGMSRTELSKFIINNSLDDILDHLDEKLDKQPDIHPSSFSSFELEERLIRLTHPRIRALEPGTEFELKELLDDEWEQFGEHGDKNRAGKRFRRLVEDGRLANTQFVEIKANNHALYRRV